jgi:hypothetical protein
VGVSCIVGIVADSSPTKLAQSHPRWLRRSAHRSIETVEADVEAWIDAWNDDPKPFVWTKSADNILDNLATHCSLIRRLRPH